MRKLTFALSIAALALPGAAMAQTAPAPAPTSAPAKARAPMADMTRAQAQARAEAVFDRIDTDRDGSISRAESDARTAQRPAKRAERPRAKQRMARMGARAERAGPLTREAFVDRALTSFDRADANRDGTVTRAERKTMRDGMRGQRRARAAERQEG